MLAMGALAGKRFLFSRFFEEKPSQKKPVASSIIIHA
jgi:hypothetical protein